MFHSPSVKKLKLLQIYFIADTERENYSNFSSITVLLKTCIFHKICNAVVLHGRVAEALPEHHQYREKEFLGYADPKEKEEQLLGDIVAHLHSFITRLLTTRKTGGF